MGVKKIAYEEIRLLKKSEKSRIILIRETDGEQILVKKILKGKLPVYTELSGCSHPYLPAIYEVHISDNATTVIEEYIDGLSAGSTELSEKQTVHVIKELCYVLEFLHRRNIIHRDIKPSNILLAKDGHIRLIDFDAARMPGKDSEQDTRLLGTRGYAPPEQYGFAQTDARTDIYSLGVTMKQLLRNKAHKPRYRRIIQKCTNLDPDKRYQSAEQVKRALSCREYCVRFCCIALLLSFGFWAVIPHPLQREGRSASASLNMLPAPENPHWNGETGFGIWGNVPESGDGEEIAYRLKFYRRDTETPPDINDNAYLEGNAKGNWGRDKSFQTYEMSLAPAMWENGYYYFAVAAAGDNVHFSDSPYAMSDAFEYTGESAPPLPTPAGLDWKVVKHENGQEVYAVWSNLSDYADLDTFNVCIYDQAGTFIANNKWTKEFIISIGQDGVWISPEVFAHTDSAYRFTVQVETSRPNEFRSSLMPDPVTEEYFSPWYYPSGGKSKG